MTDMRELITVEAFQRALAIAVAAWMIAWLVVAAVGRGKGNRRQAGLALLWAALGPLVYGLWRFYSWMVRVEPETGYVGLHKVSVAAINLVVFVVVGLVVGLALGRLHRRNDSAG